MLNLLLGRLNFKSKKEVINSINKYERYSHEEDLEDADALLIFKSYSQQSWLVFTSLRMYFIVDDTEQFILKIMWARDIENLVCNNRIELHLKEESKSKETGKLLFGKMNNSILFTYSLFNGLSPAGIILELLEKHMLKMKGHLDD